MKTVEELALEAAELAYAETAMPGKCHHDWHDVRDRHLRDLVLEEAAKVCDSVDNYSNPMTANDCADAIRAMKGQK